ncbi:hypothetical protein BC832DRAFT_77639 [Gaertneriomyces semiglobifer]|nr:hypothetical protein BC832DRAFT_77639 [Gaertneriomyces semiglobifer]
MNSHDTESGRRSQSGKDHERSAPSTSQVSTPGVETIRRFRIPLAVLLLAVTILVAGSITVPVAVLSLKGATQTVDEVPDVLRSNYIRQVHDKIEAQIEVAYELAQRNAEEYVIRSTLDSLPDVSIPFDFNAQPMLQYAYSRSVARNDFLVFAGFVRANDYDFILMAKPGQGSILCHYADGVLYNQICEYFWITETRADGTVTGTYSPSNAYPPYWIPGATTGVWDEHAYFTFNDATQTWLGAYSFYWFVKKSQSSGGICTYSSKSILVSGINGEACPLASSTLIRLHWECKWSPSHSTRFQSSSQPSQQPQTRRSPSG